MIVGGLEDLYIRTMWFDVYFVSLLFGQALMLVWPCKVDATRFECI
jgi:hypothetical protein